MTTYHYYPRVSSSWKRFDPDGNNDASSGPNDGWWIADVINVKETSARNPNWRRDIANGLCATTDAYGTKHTWAVKPARFEASNVDGWEWRGTFLDSTGISFPSLSLDVTLDIVENSALNKYVKKSQDVLRGFQGLTFLGELRESLLMIRRPATALRREVGRHIEKTRRKTRKLKAGSPSMKQAVAGSWLEAVYGWQPLFNDIEEGMATLSGFKRPTQRLIPVSGKARLETPIELTPFYPYAGPLDLVRTGRTVYVTEVLFRGRVIWDPSVQAEFQYWGVTPSEILPTAWELIPYSFVIDYFSNIGDVISAWSFGSSHIAWTDRLRRRESTLTARSVFSSWRYQNSVGYTDEGRLEKDHYYEPEYYTLAVSKWDRGQYYGSLVPDVTWEIPGVGSRKWLNLAALATVKLR